LALILNIETSTPVCSVSVSKDGVVLSSLESREPKAHASILTLFIDECVKKAGYRLSDLDAVSVSKGPGSYTGLRIGVSTAKGLCYGLEKPLISISTLQAMAAGAAERIKPETHRGMLLCPMIDARRMEVYCALYTPQNIQYREIRAEVISEASFREELANYTICFFGDGMEKCREVLTHPNSRFAEDLLPSSVYMSRLSESAYQKGKFENVAYFEPFYLKDFIAGAKKTGN
jgi:tRNA threonylcarbamoyladenosine biosynthesis protein TsaB